jgi:hypothetical protein
MTAPQNESTPIHDEVKNTPASSGDVEATSTAEDDEELETANSYKVDVKRALERETQDGKGDEDPGPSDWNGFATDGVEKEVD